MTEEVQEVPKWLKELEEKRERRLKARLGHEAGAGSPCLTCEEKCPGLDLHFWRKICKNCKCGKENHDVNDDDIYGWAQFQLLGSKPNKTRKFVIPGRKDAVELEWMPKGVAEAVDSYLKELPLNLLPIKGSPAALERKQLLQKQIPLHDIDPTLCHALSETEVKQMSDYIADVKQNSVGVGRIMKLNEMLVANRAPIQIPQMENTVLQGVNRSNLIQKLHDIKLDRKLPEFVPNRPIYNENDIQNPSIKNINDVNYATQKYNLANVANLKSYANAPSNQTLDYQNPLKQGVSDLIYTLDNIQTATVTNAQQQYLGEDGKFLNTVLPQPLVSNWVDNQDPLNMNVRDIKSRTETLPVPANKAGINKGLDNVNSVDYQYPSSPYIKFNYAPNMQYVSGVLDSKVGYNEHLGAIDANSGVSCSTLSEAQIHRANESNSGVNYGTLGESQIPGGLSGTKGVNLLPNLCSNSIDYQYPSGPGYIKDINYVPDYPLPQSGALDSNIGYGESLKPDALIVAKAKKVQIPQDVLAADNLCIPNMVSNSVDYQYATNPTYRDVNYAPTASNVLSGGLNGNTDYPPNWAINAGLAVNNNGSNTNFGLKPNELLIPGAIRNQIDNQFPTRSNIRDVNYPPNYDNSNNVEKTPPLGKSYDFNNLLPNQNVPSKYANDNKLQNYLPNDSHPSKNGQTPGPLQVQAGQLQNQIERQNPTQTNVHDIYSTNSQPPIASFKDLAYSTYNPQPSNLDEINATPMSVNIGLIKDIEYPTIKSAVQTQDISEPALPRKNVHFNLVPEEILPSCHKCNKMFDLTALVIGIDRTDALWHADCFKCAGCNQNLADLMYFYDKVGDDIYCGRDYAKIRGIPRCQACDELIFVQEYCLAENSTFHVKHFCCFECDVPLAGQNYLMEDLQPVCLPCYELLKAEKCNTCLKVIKPDERGANLRGVHFHADDKCFVCKMCTKPLEGAKFLFKNMNLYCSAPCFGADQ